MIRTIFTTHQIFGQEESQKHNQLDSGRSVRIQVDQQSKTQSGPPIAQLLVDR